MKNLMQGVFIGMLLTMSLGIAGCSPKLGGAFVELDRIPDNKALIYIYRSWGGYGFAYPIDIYVKDKQLIRLPHGSYYPYLVEPGEVELISKGWLLKGLDESLTIHVKAGETYFIKTRMRPAEKPSKVRSTQVQATFAKMSGEEGKDEIKECKLALDESAVETKP
jgi:Protein of unknown function (DUF2846)